MSSHACSVTMAALLFLARSTVLGGRTASLRRPAAFVHSAPRRPSRRPARAAPSQTHATVARAASPPVLDVAPPRAPATDAAAPPAPFRVNLLTLPLPELETLVTSWGFQKFNARQIHQRIFDQGVTDVDRMGELPLRLRAALRERTTVGALHLAVEQISQDGTTKRAYQLHDGQLIESVLMPYEDGRRTACVSSQAGCAMGCVFCATGQMGFARQLTADEIYEQVARFACELRGDGERLSNVVLMGMGEPLANYRNVIAAIRRMNTELGIGARKITVSTVGVVPNIRKLMHEDLPVRLALSLHCATDAERTALLPANRRYGGLDELMATIREYIRVRKSRVTFEWALIEGENDSRDVARSLGRLLQRHAIRPDMAHVNLIPLNPTGGFGGGPSGRHNVQKFVDVLEREFGISATPRMRRGIDINAGCGQLTASVKKKEDNPLILPGSSASPMVGVYEDDEGDADDAGDAGEDDEGDEGAGAAVPDLRHGSVVDFSINRDFVNLDDAEVAEEFVDPTYDEDGELAEAARLLALVTDTTLSPITPPPPTTPSRTHAAPAEPATRVTTTKITSADALRQAQRRRKKLLKHMKAIQKLQGMAEAGQVLNREQLEKVAKEKEWTLELESVEHNLM